MKDWEKGLAQGQGDADLAKRRYVEGAVTWAVPLNEQGEGRQSLSEPEVLEKLAQDLCEEK